jgi:hypothetical protein
VTAFGKKLSKMNKKTGANYQIFDDTVATDDEATPMKAQEQKLKPSRRSPSSQTHRCNVLYRKAFVN